MASSFMRASLRMAHFSSASRSSPVIVVRAIWRRARTTDLAMRSTPPSVSSAHQCFRHTSHR